MRRYQRKVIPSRIHLLEIYFMRTSQMEVEPDSSITLTSWKKEVMQLKAFACLQRILLSH